MNLRELFEELTRNDEHCFDRSFDDRVGCYTSAKTQIAYEYFSYGICAASKHTNQVIDLASIQNDTGGH